MSRGRDAFERLSSVVEQGSGDDVRATTFVRGLVLGAVVGAAIAGSTIWQRRHGRSTTPPVGGGPVSPRSADATMDEPPPQPG